VSEYGWRAYALPVLAALTVAVLILPANTTHSASAGGDVAGTGPVTVTQTVIAPPPTTTVFATPTVTVLAMPRPGPLSGSSAGASAPPAAGALRAAGLGAASAARISDATACSGNRADSLVLVSIRQQHAWWCDKAKAVGSTPVTTGAVNTGDATPTGTWVVQAKQADRYLVGPGYRDFVHYWMPFHGDFGLHDAPWQTFPFGSKQYTDDGSHGCVHVPEAAMARLYSWAEVGTTVVTITA
jgi:lipoprotein-anchoring transpeptidase ErfK/SrfK